MHYFDWTATSPISKASLDAYCSSALRFVGNPSSTHPLGLEAKAELDNQRKAIASLLKVDSKHLYFTSGGTEADSIVLSSVLNSPSKGEIIATGIEHSAVLEYKRILELSGWKFTTLSCPQGYLNPEKLRSALNEKVRMVLIMKVNNVTGTVQDTKALVKVVRDYSKSIGRAIHIHCDAVQALGKIPFYPEQEDFDSAAFSAHKFCGPRGIGMLYCRNKAISSLSRGGGQEAGLRPGTENLAAICAMRVALENALCNLESEYAKVLGFRAEVEKTALDCGYKLLSPSSTSGLEFSPYIINISAKPIPSEVFLRVMADKGFCLSAGSACSSNSRGKAESVLSAMNIDSSDRMSSIRISFGKDNTMDQVKELCEALRQVRQEF